MNNFFNKYQHEFSAYYNMARQNIYITLQHISNVMGYDEKDDKHREGSLWQMKSIINIEKKENQSFLIKQLSHFFPMLRVMTACEKRNEVDFFTPANIYKALFSILKLISYERDRAVHLSFVDDRTGSEEYLQYEKKIALYLDFCYTVAFRTVRKRFGKKKTKGIDVFTNKRFFTKRRFEGKKKNKEVERNYDFPYSIIDRDDRLTDVGRVLFICLFLEKRYVSIFLDALQRDIYVNLNGKQKAFLREAFSVFRIKLPRERLDIERTDTMLALDMLNELKKAPKELYEHLSEDDQLKFIVTSETGDEILLRRYDDRFPFFVLKYIDDRKLFNSIRFQVNVGKYRFLKKEDKVCLDETRRVRVLQKELNGFGRLQEMEQFRSSESSNWKSRLYIKKHIDITRDDPAILPYITDSKAQYVFYGEKMGLNWAPYSNVKGTILKPIERNYIPEVNSGNSVSCVPPKCWISIYELPAMLFHILLNGFSGAETEELIRKEVEKYTLFFKDISEGVLKPLSCDSSQIESKYGIRRTDIPEKLKDYLFERATTDFESNAFKVVNEMIRQNELSIKRFQKKLEKVNGADNKMGKKLYVEIRSGRLASYLMKDMIALQPTALKGEQKGKDKLTGLNYSILNAELAMYNAKRDKKELDNLKKMLEKANLIGDSNNKHPFLDEIFQVEYEDVPKTTIEFYQKYMKCRLNWLKRISKNKNFKDVNILKPDRMKWAEKNEEYYKNLAKRYLSQPIELPRCLFEDSIVDKMIEICSDNESLQELKRQLIRYRNKEEGVRFNVAYLIIKYHELVMNDKCQKFYGWDRGYKVINKLEGVDCFKQTNFLEHYDFEEKINHYIDDLRIQVEGRKFREASGDEKQNERNKILSYKKELNANERTLRRLKVQDILLFYMAKNIIGAEVKNFKMKSISPYKEEGILELQIPFSMKITLADGTERTIYQEAIKIKNYGDFFCYLYDDRVKSLLPQIKKAEINRMELDRELMNYDLTRPEIFSLILDFEKAINDKYPEMTKERHGFTDLLNKLEDLGPMEKENIRLVRNAFSHNKYPNIEKIKEDIPEVAVGVRKSLMKDAKKIIK